MNRKLLFILTILIVFASAELVFADTYHEASVPGWNETHTSFYDENLNPVTGIRFIDNAYYMFSDDGILQTDVYSINPSDGKLYYFGKTGEGAIYTGVYKGKYYSSGIPEKTGVSSQLLKLSNGSYYYINASGKIYSPGKAGVYKAAL